MMNRSLMTIGNSGASMSLNLPKTQTFDEWAEVGRDLANANKVLNWWIGDWWAAGSHRYGERAKVAAEGIFGREFQGLMDMASVCRAFTTSRRREGLSFTHHREVAGLSPSKADELLDRAERDNWSTRDIRAEAITIRSNAGPTTRREQSGDDREWSALVGAWNRASIGTRERFLSEIDGTAAIVE